MKRTLPALVVSALVVAVLASFWLIQEGPRRAAVGEGRGAAAESVSAAIGPDPAPPEQAPPVAIPPTHVALAPEWRRLAYSTRWADPALPPEHAAFRDWAESYRQTPVLADRAALVPAGVALARARRPVMRALIQRDPAAALAVTVPLALRRSLPSTVVAELEEPFSDRGNFLVSVNDYPVTELIRRKQMGLPPAGFEYAVELDGQEYPAFVYGRRAHQSTKFGLPLHGLRLDGAVALHEAPFRLLAAEEAAEAGGAWAVELAGRVNVLGSPAAVGSALAELVARERGLGPHLSEVPSAPGTAQQSGLPSGYEPATASAPASAWTIGSKQVLVIRVDFSDLAGEPRRGSTIYTPAYVQDLADTQIAPYYTQSSYGQTSLTHTVSTKVYRLPRTSVYYATNSTGNTTLHADARAAAAADFNLAGYDRIMVLFSTLSGVSGSLITYGGRAQIGAANIWINGYFDFRVVAHELGHTYGLRHANLWQVADGNPVSSAGSSTEYGDDYDTMGANYANDRRTDFNPWFKNLLGWVNDNQVQTVATNGTYRLNRFDHRTATGPLALKIVRDGTRHVWVGVRRNFTTNAAMQQGAYVFWGYTTNQASNLLDLNTPGSGVGDAALAPGATLLDTVGNFSLRPIANGGTAPAEYLDVQVTLGLNGLPVFTVQPQSQGFAPGTTVTLAATVTGTDPISYQWRKNGADLAGATTTTLRFASAQATDVGTYTLRASNAIGAVVSDSAVLSVNAPPVITAQPWPLTTSAGRTVSFTVGVEGPLAPAYQWLKDGTAIAGATAATYTLTNVQPANAASYAVVLTNAFGVVTSAAAQLTVQAAATPPSNNAWANAWVVPFDRGAVSATNVGATGETGEPAHVNSNATATSVWFRWTPQVSGMAQIDTIGSSLDTALAVYTGTTLAGLTKVVEDDQSGGLNTSKALFSVVSGTTYHIAVGDAGSSRLGGTIALRYQALVAPSITAPPTAQLAALGGTATFAVSASGGDLSYQWYRNGAPLSGATRTTLALSALQPADGGVYHVVAYNFAGSATSGPAALASVDAVPTLLAAPTDLMVTAGESVSLGVVATGAGTVSYQWRRHGLPLAGATAATLGFPRVSRTDAGLYDVIVRAGLTSVVSPAARLAVRPAAFPQLVAPDPDWELRPESSGGLGYAVATLADGRAYLAGSFVSLDGVRRVGVVRIDATGAIDASFVTPEIDGPVRALALQADGRLLIGGEFVRINGRLRNRLARLHPDGTLDASFDAGAGANSTVYTLALQADDRILVGGAFTGFSGSNCDFLVRLTSDGARDAGFLTRGMSSTVYALAVQPDGKILVGGAFTSGYRDLAGVFTARSRLARLNTDGTLDSAYSPAPNNTVYAIASHTGGTSVVGGLFTQIGSMAVGRIARLGADGTLDAGFNTTAGAGIAGGTTPVVNALAVLGDGRIVVVGSFSTYAGGAAANLVRLQPSGARDPELPPVGFSFGVNALGVFSTGQMVVGGGFSNYLDASGAATARMRFARLNPDGALASGYNFAVRSAGSINSLVPLSDGRLLVTGFFTTLRGTTSPTGVARINPDGTVDPSFNSGGWGANSNVYAAIGQPDGKIVITGAFTTYNGSVANGLARLMPDGTLDSSFSVGTGLGGGYGYTLTLLSGGRVFVGGSFTTVHGSPRNRVAVLHDSGVLDSSFNPGAGAASSVYTSVVQRDGKVLIGGSFSIYDGTTVGRLARLQPDGRLDSTLQAGSGANSSVYALGLATDGAIYAGGAFTTFAGATRAGLVRLTSSGAVDANFLPPTVNNVHALQVQENGPVIVRGSFTSAGSAPGTAFLARLNVDGTRDSTFVAGGFTSASSIPAVLAMNDTGQVFMPSNGATGMSATEAALRPVISLPPTGGNVSVGAAVNLMVGVDSTLPVAYQWWRDNTLIPGATDPTLSLINLQPAQAGVYTVVVTSELGAVTSTPAVVSVGHPPGLLGFSMRAVASATMPVAGGFSIEALAAKPVLLRAVGPSLAAFGVTAVLADPWLDAHHAGSGNIAGSNDDWGSAANAAQIPAAAAQAGAFALSAGSKDAVILGSYPSGTYRIRTGSNGGAGGNVLLEIYAVESTPRLVHLAMQGEVGSAPAALIAGLILDTPSAGRSYLVRALGRSFDAAGRPFDPRLAIASGGTVLASNDNWGGSAPLVAAAVTAGAMPLSASSNAAALLFAPSTAGAYTLQITGAGEGGGLVWIEVFEVDESRAASMPAAVVGNPLPVAVAVGQPAALGVVTLGKPAPTYQWRKDGAIVPGATAATLSLAATQLADAGAYDVIVSNPTGTAVSAPATVVVGAPHSADTDQNFRINLFELTRVIELYNTRHVTTRTGAYAVATAASEDGFNPDATRPGSAVVSLTRLHSADSDRDGKLSLFELTRVIELYNVRSGTVRTGQYRVSAGTEDGFAPGP